MAGQRPSYALMIANRESFSHERLKLAENSIRLFQVHGEREKGRNSSSSSDEIISLQITQYASHRRPPYKAISYTWGLATANTCEILVNGRAFRIHENLRNLLTHVRARKELSFLWADALCIDQANLKERNFHVQLMGRIYEQAKSVIVWLGVPSSDRTEVRAMDFVKEMTSFRKSHGETVFAKTYLAPSYVPRWETLLQMCQNRYWTRTWIVQEFLRAPEIEVMCGAASIDWTEFESLLVALREVSWSDDGNHHYHHHKHETLRQILSSRPARLTLRRRTRAASSLHELLKEYHDSMCTERRDKIYGILGLASDCGEDETTGKIIGVIPDYTKHIVQVYIDAVLCIEKSLISRELLPSVANLVRQTLLISDRDFADYAQNGSRSLSSPDLPSLTISPAYVGRVDTVIPSWTSIRDLKLQLSTIDWGQFVGYEMRSPRPGLGRRSSTRAIHSGIPEDMISNTVNAVEAEPEILHLHNYPAKLHLTTSLEHIALHPEDKRLHDNAELNKPCVILEHNRTRDTLRLGLACTNTRRGDLILQFRGLDTTLICREIGYDIVIVGKAVMIKHSQLQHEHTLDAICAESPWLSQCPFDHNLDNLQLNTDALSLAELLTK